MARPRIHQPITLEHVDTAAPWRDFVDPDDIDAIAARFRQSARWAAHGSGVTIPDQLLTADDDIDALDEWLDALDPGRRAAAWRSVFQR